MEQHARCEPQSLEFHDQQLALLKACFSQGPPTGQLLQQYSGMPVCDAKSAGTSKKQAVKLAGGGVRITSNANPTPKTHRESQCAVPNEGQAITPERDIADSNGHWGRFVPVPVA